MRDVKSDKRKFLDILKKDWIWEYLKRILFVVFVIWIINAAYDYVRVLPVKVDPMDLLVVRCNVKSDVIKIDVKEWEEDKEPELKYSGISTRYDDEREILYISLIVGEEGDGKPYSEIPIVNKYKDLKKIVIEGGILNIHQRTIWADGEEKMAVKPSPKPTNSAKSGS